MICCQCTVYGYPNSCGGRCSNMFFYVLYNHPILSIIFVHPAHPFTRQQRLIVFMCSVCFAVCFTFVVLGTPLLPLVRRYVMSCYALFMYFCGIYLELREQPLHLYLFFPFVFISLGYSSFLTLIPMFNNGVCSSRYAGQCATAKLCP
jgi:hypothetical protein